jgi:hypothetical protein
MRVISYTMVIAAWVAAMYIALSSAPMERKLDCSLAEFHPDYTPAMRQACREQRKIKT